MLDIKDPKVAIPVVLIAGLFWSFGPYVVRHIDEAKQVPWQYLFTRGIVIFLILNIYLFFEDVSIFKSLCNLFEKSLKTSSQGIQTESLPLNDFAALSGAAELIFKGWHKEAIPLSHRKKSIISSFFERFF